MPDHIGRTVKENEPLIVATVIHAHSVTQNKYPAGVRGLLGFAVFITYLGHQLGKRLGQNKLDGRLISENPARCQEAIST
ncbi:MAG: hypothetical protein B7Y41_15470 [Hydrogenophilales bacterium 28-61-23]|nr:MAG: hypothetical protein B7Y41_15470 [Hydrogenophilales bacterium 28-61-23]